jgi:hypothetical protein
MRHNHRSAIRANARMADDTLLLARGYHRADTLVAGSAV